MDIVDIFTHQSKFFRICFHDRRKYSLWIGFIFIVIWFEYIYNFILIIRSFDPKLECQFLELGCGLLPTYRINWNVTIKLFRSVGFLLFNYWYFSDNRWVFLANEQFLKLPFGVPAKRMQSWIKKMCSRHHSLSDSIQFDHRSYSTDRFIVRESNRTCCRHHYRLYRLLFLWCCISFKSYLCGIMSKIYRKFSCRFRTTSYQT
ncbi:hypothetical protein NH340_JMT01252 [Sarcoptes scabiei]|nr:hypothetical protein NH340_JMT01252 [Sarcoptes scabiei]